MSSTVGNASGWARGGAHYLFCGSCTLHFWGAVMASSAAVALLVAGERLFRAGLVVAGVAGLVWIGWGFWSILRHIAAKRAEAAIHQKIADGVETAADLYLTLTDPDAIYCMEPVKGRWAMAVFIVIAGLILAGIGLIFTDILTSLGPETWGEKWRGAMSIPAFRAWILFLALTMIELLACQLSTTIRHLVRAANHGRRFAEVRGTSQL